MKNLTKIWLRILIMLLIASAFDVAAQTKKPKKPKKKKTAMTQKTAERTADIEEKAAEYTADAEMLKELQKNDYRHQIEKRLGAF